MTAIFPPTGNAALKHKQRRLVLFFDGTASPLQTNYTNVITLFSFLRNDGIHQMLYYQPIGSYIKSGFWSSIFMWNKILNNAFALYLSNDVMSGYRWLVKNYNPGDKLYFFGCSHGAYTARVLAAMLHKVGLILQEKLDNKDEEVQNKVSLAFNCYMSNNEAIALEFKKQYCCSICIDFLGAWDTVSSIGYLWSQTLPFVDSNASIWVFRQALSLGEHRSRFQPNLFHYNALNKEAEEIFQTDVKEVWFAGSHSDVCGGSTPNFYPEIHYNLAKVSLYWMIEELMHSGCQILFRDEHSPWKDVPATIRQDQPSSLPQGVSPLSQKIKALIACCILQPITDKLFKNPLWWILEILPMSYTFQNMQGKWVTTFRPHFGHARQLPPDPLFHTSVKTRMDDPSLEYKPRAWYEHDTERYVS